MGATIERNGLELIKRFEGFMPKEYVCPAGKRTIGYGHVINTGESFDGGISKEQAERLLKEDVSASERAIERYVNVPLKHNQFDALVSFVFNVGIAAFSDSTLLEYLNKGDYVSAAGEFPRWCKVNKKGVKGLLNRRIEEMSLFME